MQLSDRSALIKEKAIDLGFLLCGISKAQYLEKEAANLEHWLAQNYHGKITSVLACKLTKTLLNYLCMLTERITTK